MLNESIVNSEYREYILCPRGNKIFFSLKEPMMIPRPGASKVYPMPAWCRFLSHALFLLPTAKPFRISQKYQSCCFMVVCTCLATSTTTTSYIVCIASRSCKDSTSTCFACSALVARLKAFTQVRPTNRQMYETPLGSRPVNLNWAERGKLQSVNGYYHPPRLVVWS